MATYLIEGNSTKQFSFVNGMLKENPNLLSKILDMITKGSIDYVREQIKNGVDAIMIFDTWGGLLSGDNYEKFSLNYIQKIISSTYTDGVPVIYYSRSKSNFAELKKLDINCVGISSENNLGEMYKFFDKKFAIQGNLDVDILKEDESTIKKEISKTLDTFPFKSGHIFNLGTGITPDIHPDKVAYLVDLNKQLCQDVCQE